MFLKHLMTTRHNSPLRRSFPAMLLLALVMLLPAACVDEDFDAPPPGGEDPNLTVNASIADLKAMHTLGQYRRSRRTSSLPPSSYPTTGKAIFTSSLSSRTAPGASSCAST
jgi:hypothetical protein